MHLPSDTSSPGEQAWPSGQSVFTLQSVSVSLKHTRLLLPLIPPHWASQYSLQSWQLKPVLIWKQPP
jgi:hypothetical protein